MKKLILTTSLVALVAATSFGQGTVLVKTTVTKNTVFSSTDLTTLTAVPTNNTVAGFGTVQYEVYTAPTGSPAPTLDPVLKELVFTSAWSATALTLASPAYANPGVMNSITFTAPSASGAAGGSILMEIVAYVNGTVNGLAITPGAQFLYGYSGNPVFGGAFAGAPALDWSQGTGNPGATPQVAPAAVAVGTLGLGSIILEPIPEPSTIALGGLAAAALLAFRRKK